jgi:hypothetical protein
MLIPTPAHAIGEVYGPYLLSDGVNCIDNPNSSSSNNTVMIIYTCSGNSNQLWSNETAVTNSDYWISNGASGKCLTVSNPSTAGNNTPIIQYSCNSGTNERWKYEQQQPCSGSCAINNPWILNGVRYNFVGFFKIKTLLSGGRCITVKNASHTSGATLLQYDCSSPGANVWMQYIRA